jgi:hypothetical protein
MRSLRAAVAALLVVAVLSPRVVAQGPQIILPWTDQTHNVQENGQTHVFTALTAVTTTPAFQALTSWHAYYLLVTGGPSTCKFILQGSMDGANWFNLDGTLVSCASSTYYLVGGGSSNFPTVYVRGNLMVLTGGSSPTVQLQYAGR